MNLLEREAIKLPSSIELLIDEVNIPAQISSVNMRSLEVKLKCPTSHDITSDEVDDGIF